MAAGTRFGPGVAFATLVPTLPGMQWGMAAMNRIQSYVCDHPRLRAVDYDETYHWTVACPDCGHSGRMTQAEWRLRRKGLTPALSKLLIKDEGADSGRAVRVR
jgi:hypothetical protein